MDDLLLEHDGELCRGEVVDRPNRFVLKIRFDAETARVFLGDPGALEFLSPGDPVLCSPATDPERKTEYDAIAVDTGDCYISLRSTLANTIFERAIEDQLISRFAGYSIVEREPVFPTHGRGDFRLDHPTGSQDVFVEVKSCTHAEDGVGKFPDRQTKRGRRHLQTLMGLVGDDTETHLVFVAQRPDVDSIEPFRAVDPEFADLLGEAKNSGVGIHAMSVEFDPPEYRLRNASLPVNIR